MGVKDFSKAFKAVGTVKWKDKSGETIAIDAMTELYRAALGAKKITTLTDASGKPTMHINVYLANLIEMQKQSINQIHIFDYDPSSEENADFHNPAKLDEIKKRQQRKDIARKKRDALFSDSDSEDSESEKKQKKLTKEDMKNQLDKQLFSLDKSMINDIKLILNCLNIKYIEAPKGFEGECIAAYLNERGIVDAVYSGDTDPIVFGAPVLYRKNPRDKKIYEYTQEDILRQIKETNSKFRDPDLDDIRKTCLILGTDFAPKTPRVGSGTVLKKLHELKLTEKQKDARMHFERKPKKSSIIIHNEDKTPFVDCDVNVLLEWLVKEKSFSRSRITNMLKKVIDENELEIT